VQLIFCLIVLTRYDRKFASVKIARNFCPDFTTRFCVELPYCGTSDAYIEYDEILKLRIHLWSIHLWVRHTLCVVAHSILLRQRHVYSSQAIRVHRSSPRCVFVFGINTGIYLLRGVWIHQNTHSAAIYDARQIITQTWIAQLWQRNHNIFRNYWLFGEKLIMIDFNQITVYIFFSLITSSC